MHSRVERIRGQGPAGLPTRFRLFRQDSLCDLFFRPHSDPLSLRRFPDGFGAKARARRWALASGGAASLHPFCRQAGLVAQLAVGVQSPAPRDGDRVWPGSRRAGRNGSWRSVGKPHSLAVNGSALGIDHNCLSLLPIQPFTHFLCPGLFATQAAR